MTALTFRLALCLAAAAGGLRAAADATLDAPRSARRFEAAEFVLRTPPFQNPFTEAQLTGEFRRAGAAPWQVFGFADSPDGDVWRLRFAPDQGGASYQYTLHFRASGIDQRFKGELRSEDSNLPGPAVVDAAHPRHFVFAGSRKPMYPLGYTAYHLLDPANDEAQVDATIDYVANQGFNRLRFLLAGYPRDFGGKSTPDTERSTSDPWKLPNYGARPGRPNPLPAWPGTPHHYDFRRFNVAYWQRVDRAVRRMRERGVQASCIFTIEKGDLPDEYGRLTDDELRYYRYTVARLAAFDNVWWDLGNEHNEYRDAAWGDAMGAYVKAIDPFHRLVSAHGYAEFRYPKAGWADFIITQQYGDEWKTNGWALRCLPFNKPYINEEYGYEGNLDKPGHGQTASWVRRLHWSVAMAGGYGTYGDWSGGVSHFYMGVPGPGEAARQLKFLRSFFERLPFAEMEPDNSIAGGGFCLARAPELYVFYFPRGGEHLLDVKGAAQWYDPRTGAYREGPKLPGTAAAPSREDWVLLVRSAGPAATR